MKARDWPAFAWIEIVETHIRKISSGQRRPASRIARSDPSAIMSLSAQTAVGRGIGFSSVSVFEWPPRLSNVVSCTYPGRRGSLDSRIARLKPLSLSFAFVRWNGPVMVANFLCPSRIKQRVASYAPCSLSAVTLSPFQLAGSRSTHTTPAPAFAVPFCVP